jgi:hypothetical protein
MALYTTDFLRSKGFSKARVLAKSEGSLLFEDAQKFDPAKTYDIFLSHSFREAQQIYGLKLDIEEMGYSVYVDWIEDPDLNRERVTKYNALILKKRMQNCRSLFYVTTQTSTESKWMPWELGYFDGIKKSRVAILPVSDQSTNQYKGQEYLGLYPYVTRNGIKGENRITLWIHVDGDTYIVLDEWLKGKEPVKRG